MSDGIQCCVRCGRDTANKCGYCGTCLSGRPGYVYRNGEMKGRPARDPLLEDSEPDDETSDTRYHGDNYET